MNNLLGHLRGEDTSYTVPVKNDPLWWHDQELQQTATGYGKKLTTPYKVFLFNRWYRVYTTCYSNVASNWVMVRGEKFFFTMINV